MAKPVSGQLGYDNAADRPTVELRSGTKKVLVEGDSGGGGSITEVKSTDLSVTVTGGTGPIVDLSVTGGGTVDSVTSGDGTVTIDNSDPANPDLSVDRLTRSDNDWASFALKSPPELDDVLLIEDSSDGWAKKRITVEDLLALVFPASPSPFYASDLILTTGWNPISGPQALYHAAHDKTYVAWQMVGASGQKGIHIAYYDHAAGLWSDRYRVGCFLLANDDHGHPAIAIDSSGYFYVFYGSHNTTQNFSVSTNVNDITEWTQLANPSGIVSYPQPFIVGSTLYLSNRDDSSPGSSNYPTQIRSGSISGGSVTLGSKTILVDFGSDSRMYRGGCFVVGTDVHFVATKANFADSSRKGVYYFIYKTATGAVTNFDGSTSVASGSLPVNLTQSNASFRLYDHGSNDGDLPVLEFDSNGDAHIVFLVGINGTTANYDVKHMYLSGGVWSTPAYITSIPDRSTFGYVNTFTLVPGVSGKMELWLNNVSGNMVRYRMSAAKVWGNEETISRKANYDFENCYAVRNADPDSRIVFAETIRPATDSTAARLRMFTYGDGGPIAAIIDQTVVDSSIASVKLLLGMNHRDTAVTLIDDSPSCLIGAVFNGNAQIDTAQKKFGSASLLLDGTGDYVTYPSSSDFSGAQTNFTFECWVRPNEAGRLQVIAGKRSSATTASEWEFFKTVANQLSLIVWNNAAAQTINITSAATLSNGTWYHVAISKASTAWKMFLNGTLDGSATESAGAAGTNSELFCIGREVGSTVRDWNGWIDEIRVTSAARYTATFTAPSAAFPRH